MTPAAETSTLRLATRGSALALRQATLAAEALRANGHGDVETLVIRTEGDRRVDAPIDQLEGQGWFTADIERSLLEGRADIAVHSAKDLPSVLAPGLGIAAYLVRADVRDGVVSASGEPLEALPAGATVGTSSARRAGLLAAMYPGLRPIAIRGNVDTRLRKLDAGEFDALLLALRGTRPPFARRPVHPASRPGGVRALSGARRDRPRDGHRIRGCGGLRPGRR